MTALAVHEATDVVAAGSRDKVWLFRIDGAMIRWEWCTAIDGPDAGSGGVVDGPVTALEFDEPSGDLYAGNDIALNIRAAASGARGVSRSESLARVTHHKHLPGRVKHHTSSPPIPEPH